jgi:2-amino-4-hydroxy-6-hydroxymethyldihydropteridine diphosphokinase
MTPQLFLGFGGNIGDVRTNFRSAISKLEASEHFEIAAVSSAYQTQALTVDGIDDKEPRYWNIVVNAACDLSAPDLLAFCKNLERESGRLEGAPRWTSRTLDIDILAWGALSVDSESLQIPHAQCLERSFVLAPWNEVAPTFYLSFKQENMRIEDAWTRLQTATNQATGILEVDRDWFGRSETSEERS